MRLPKGGEAARLEQKPGGWGRDLNSQPLSIEVATSCLWFLRSGVFWAEYLVFDVNLGNAVLCYISFFIKVSNILQSPLREDERKVQYSFLVCLEAVCRVRSLCPFVSTLSSLSPWQLAFPVWTPVAPRWHGIVLLGWGQKYPPLSTTSEELSESCFGPWQCFR